MTRSLTGFAAALIVCLAAAAVAPAWAAAPPAPKDYLGFRPGDDYKLADYTQIAGYFDALEKSSPRIRLVRFGASSEGRPMLAAFISSEANLKKLDHWREVNRRLALGLADAEEARRLSQEGKAIVWIDSGLHATEVAPAQHAPELAWRMITDESPETVRIRDNVILIQIPAINPDGLQMVAEWYRKNVGTSYEIAPLPWLYQKYAGHDNNRDWFMLNLAETRAVSRLLFEEWFPQIVYNQHQQPAFPARIFVPPYAEPLNPNIPPAVMEGINVVGAAIKERFAREAKPGVLSYFGFDAWWNGGLRSAPAFHNMHGILTETAAHYYGTPRTYSPADLPERFANGIPTREPTVFYTRPWLGGKWGVRDAIEYMLTADWAILDLAASRRAEFLLKAWETARGNIEAGEKGKPYAYVVEPTGQWDLPSAETMLERLAAAGVAVRRARAGFTAGGRTYGIGSYVMLAAQPFRGYLADLMEPQKYPELRAGQNGPTKRPYDIAGWTLPMQMGVKVDRIEEPFDPPPLDEAAAVTGQGERSAVDSADTKSNAVYRTIARLLGAGQPVRWSADGRVLLDSSDPAFGRAAWELKMPRVAVYESWVPNSDAGWTEWLFDNYRVPYQAVHDDDLHHADLRARFDTLVLPAQGLQSILHGSREGVAPRSRAGGAQATTPALLQRPEYAGGIGTEGVYRIEQFVRAGGTLIALDSATELVTSFYPVGVRALLRFQAPVEGPPDESAPVEGFYCPGSLLRITVDPAHPISFGMPKEAFAFSSGGQAFEVSWLPEYNKGDREVKTVARYAAKDVLASGWISGERAVLGKAILVDARMGKGRVVLYGFRPQHRGQTFGTFKLLLNAVYLGSAEKLGN